MGQYHYYYYESFCEHSLLELALALALEPVMILVLVMMSVEVLMPVALIVLDLWMFHPFQLVLNSGLGLELEWLVLGLEMRF
jgi:hypothetical protein